MSQIKIKLQPQPGPQTDYLSTSADIALYGGAAGGGKTFGLLLEPTRHLLRKPKFGGVIFRKEATQIRNEGGLWHESLKVYNPIGATPLQSTLKWDFPHPDGSDRPGARMKFAGLENDAACLSWQGAQIAYIGFDELTHFTEFQFFYMLSRNRSTSGVRPYVRATTNPDVNSWVRKFIDWWIGPDGFAIPERSGVIRWFLRRNDTLYWFDSKQAVHDQFGYGKDIQPKSFTFIASNIYDNKILMEQDPGYLGNLLALPMVERMRLLNGNWNIKASAGNVFRRDWFKIVDAIPPRLGRKIRHWDRAATKPNPSNSDPDWTRGVRLEALVDGSFIFTGLASMRDTPGQVENLVINTASQDGFDCQVGIEQDPGSAGVSDVANMVRVLPGYQVKIMKPSKDKLTRAKPLSSACENGLILLLRGAWNEEFISELENFSEDLVGKDDIVDAASGAYNALCENVSVFDSL